MNTETKHFQYPLQTALRKFLADVVEETFPEVEIATQEISLEHPKEESHGDYATTISLMLAKKIKQSPINIAQKLVETIEKRIATSKAKGLDQTNNKKGQKESSNHLILQSYNQLIKKKEIPYIIKKVEVAGPGFINLWLTEEFLVNELKRVLRGQQIDGIIKNSLPEAKKKIIVEFSSPNIAKPFTIGHLRSTIIGHAVANLYEAIGWEVYRDNHLGDWGTQFGKQIYAIKTWGDEKKLDEAKNPVKELVNLYVKFHKEAEKNPALDDEARLWFKKLEDGDSEARRLWKKCIEWSLKEFDKIYRVLEVTFTENNGKGYGESFFEHKMKPILEELQKKRLIQQSEGAWLVHFPKDKYPPLMVVKSDGATLYATRDLATDKFRLDTYGKDIVIVNEVGAEQTLYWQQIFETEYMLGWYKPGQRIHLKHGMYKFKEGKMSTRKGNVIWLEDVLNEAFQRVKKLVGDRIDEETMRDIAVGAIKWQDLRRETIHDITFDYDAMLNLEGDSGPYLQYTYARTQSVLRKAELVDYSSSPHSGINSVEKFSTHFVRSNNNTDFNDEELAILRSLYRFPEVILEAADKYSPHLICNYLFDLAQKFNTFYNSSSILGNEKERIDAPVKDFRVALTSAVGITVKSGLTLLGIKAPEKM